MAKTIFYSLAALVRKILSCHEKIKFISPRHLVISSILKLLLNLDIMQHETVAIFMTIDDIFSFKSCFITFFFQCLLDVLIMSN